MSASLVGSEMCIRDSACSTALRGVLPHSALLRLQRYMAQQRVHARNSTMLHTQARSTPTEVHMLARAAPRSNRCKLLPAVWHALSACVGCCSAWGAFIWSCMRALALARALVRIPCVECRERLRCPGPLCAGAQRLAA
eukprot:10130736-Alexandrium_andersonii.AAC.1